MNFVEVERQLYKPVLRWLDKDFRTSDAFVTRAASSAIFCADISQQAAGEGGHWSRPDLAAVTYTRGRFTPAWETSLYSFEIKTFSGLSQASVYEAVAHTRFVNFSYLLWEDALELSPTSWAIVDLCRDFGVGAITTSNPEDDATYKLRAKPRRHNVSVAESDAFLMQRFPQVERDRIMKWLSATGWKQAGEGEVSI